MLDPKDLQGILGTVRGQLSDLEEKAKIRTIETNSGGGMIKAKFNGAGELIDINIDDELLEDKQTLQILLISAINDGYKEIQKAKQDDILDKVKDIDIGNLFR